MEIRASHRLLLAGSRGRSPHQSKDVESALPIASLIAVMTPHLHFDDIVRGGFAHSGGADADEARSLPQLGEIGRAEIAHTRLDTANQLRPDAVHRGREFLEGLDSFGSDLLGGVG